MAPMGLAQVMSCPQMLQISLSIRSMNSPLVNSRSKLGMMLGTGRGWENVCDSPAVRMLSGHGSDNCNRWREEKSERVVRGIHLG